MPVEPTVPGTTPFGPARQAGESARLRHEGVTDTDRNVSVAMHLTPLGTMFFPPLFFAPLVLWLIRKDESVFADDHGRETVNALISFVLWHVVLTVTILGILLLPVLWVVAIVNLIRGAIAASSGEYFRYPMTVRFIE